MKIEEIRLDEISQDPANVRKHSDRNIEAIVASLRAFGQQKPIVVDNRGIILAGNGTYEAAKRLGWETIEVYRTGLEGRDAVAFAIADNRTGELAEWDLQALGATMRDLKDSGFDLASLGWEDFEINPILAANWSPPSSEENDDFDFSGSTQKSDGNDDPIFVSPEQRETIEEAIERVRVLAEDEALSEGRCVEIICREYLDRHTR